MPDKDFWNEVVIFTSKDQNLTKAHVQYLEAKLLERTRRRNRYAVANGNTTAASSFAGLERKPWVLGCAGSKAPRANVPRTTNKYTPGDNHTNV